ncbi:MAG TPA: PAS domain-containing protein [Tenuifilaceae bacterium]|nr:PAS domain-containing protein [Tenuifilaceae bacterium]HPJ44651.1 PAS domain-containing protein [Tenuifilaceae bacterium]
MNLRFKMKIRTKMLVYVLVTSAIILLGIGFYFQFRTYRLALNNARVIAKSYAEKAANQTRSELELDLGFSRALAQSMYGYYKFDSVARDSIYFTMVKNQVEQNNRYMSVWYNLEYSATRPSYTKNYGRRSISAFMQNGVSQILVEHKNVQGDNLTSGYYKAKSTNVETILDPYPYTYDGVTEFLVTSICVPIRHNGDFVGLAGVDIDLNKFQRPIEMLKPYPNTQSFLLSSNGTIVAHTNPTNSGKFFREVFPEIEIEHGITGKAERGTDYNFEWEMDGKKYLTFLTPIKIGNSSLFWSIGVAIPVSEIVVEARNAMYSGILVALLGIIILTIVLFYVANSITKPIVQTTNVLNDLAEGDIDRSKKMLVTSGDEIEMMATSVNKLIEGLNLTENFAREIGKGNLDAEFQLLGDKDILGISLIEMQKSLKHAQKIEKERKEEEQKQNWATQGMALFGEILRQNNDNLNELSFNIVKTLVDYTESNQGGVFVINENDKDNPILEMTACYAFDRRKFLEKTVEIGEGLVGRCQLESKTIFMNDVPPTYINISSGLGKERPRNLILVPLKTNEGTLGVLELATFNNYEKHQIDFIEKIAESIASTISSVRINIRTAQLLAKSQQQAEEMSAQEEEMRQNMEELQATQEEMERKRAEQDKIQEELHKEISMLNALMQNIPDYIYFKDQNSHFIRISKSMVKLFNASEPEELVGKSDFDFHKKENAEKFFAEEQEIMRSLVPLVDNVVHEKFDDGKEQWVSTTKMPLLDSNGDVIGVWGISKIVTDLKKAELDAQEMAKETKTLKSKLTKQQAEYQAIVKAVDSSTYVVEYNPEGFITRTNEPMLTLLGKSAAQLLGKHHSDFFRQKLDDDETYKNFWSDLQKGIIHSQSFKGKIGSKNVNLLETYSPVVDSNGNVVKIICIAVKE